jgi:hypothetical protein
MPSRLPAPTRLQSRSRWHVGVVELVPAREVLRRQLAAYATFQALDAQAPASWLHARRLPHLVADAVDLPLGIEVYIDAILSHSFRCMNGSVRLH